MQWGAKYSISNRQIRALTSAHEALLFRGRHAYTVTVIFSSMGRSPSTTLSFLERTAGKLREDQSLFCTHLPLRYFGILKTSESRTGLPSRESRPGSSEVAHVVITRPNCQSELAKEGTLWPLSIWSQRRSVGLDPDATGAFGVLPGSRWGSGRSRALHRASGEGRKVDEIRTQNQKRKECQIARKC